MKSSDSLYCVLPKSGGCDVVDGTPLVWRYGIAKCDLPEAQFIFDADSGSIIHNCTRKPVCSENGGNDYSIPILISSKCPAMKLTRKFTRTFGMSFFHTCTDIGARRSSKRFYKIEGSAFFTLKNYSKNKAIGLCLTY